MTFIILFLIRRLYNKLTINVIICKTNQLQYTVRNFSKRFTKSTLKNWLKKQAPTSFSAKFYGHMFISFKSYKCTTEKKKLKRREKKGNKKKNKVITQLFRGLRIFAYQQYIALLHQSCLLEHAFMLKLYYLKIQIVQLKIQIISFLF